MIRVGFILSFTGSGWVGGLNYYRTLLQALSGSEIVQPVVLAGPNIPDSILAELPKVELIRTRLVDPRHPIMKARKVIEALYGRAFILERFLRYKNISVLSHSGHLGPRSNFPTIGWIPDFQHVRLPAFFSEKERRSRDRGFRRLADFCKFVVVSSRDAQKDFSAFHPVAAHKAEVLHFVPGSSHGAFEDRGALLGRYGIEAPYLHLPNQFWTHKNHKVVVEALARVRARGRRALVVCTGATIDSRAPGHFDDVMARAKALGVEDDFRVLGLVPFADLNGVMEHAVALINPSLFEGWSTTVEEAKSTGKTIILSNIPVHLEQAPAHGVYFSPADPDQLADAMLRVLDAHSPSAEAEQRVSAQRLLPTRVKAFAERFEEIVTAAWGVT